jgi:hypothetical protein
MEERFSISCNARLLMSTAVSDEMGSEERFHAALAALREDFEPNKTANAIELKHELKLLSDKGKKFTTFYAEFKRLAHCNEATSTRYGFGRARVRCDH